MSQGPRTGSALPAQLQHVTGEGFSQPCCAVGIGWETSPVKVNGVPLLGLQREGWGEQRKRHKERRAERRAQGSAGAWERLAARPANTESGLGGTSTNTSKRKAHPVVPRERTANQAN